MSYHRFLAGVLASLFFAPVQGQDFPPVYNSEADRVATPMTAENAAARMLVPSGFRVTVFASEPDVQNPIAMTWDARGRLWVAVWTGGSDPA